MEGRGPRSPAVLRVHCQCERASSRVTRGNHHKEISSQRRESPRVDIHRCSAPPAVSHRPEHYSRRRAIAEWCSTSYLSPYRRTNPPQAKPRKTMMHRFLAASRLSKCIWIVVWSRVGVAFSHRPQAQRETTHVHQIQQGKESTYLHMEREEKKRTTRSLTVLLHEESNLMRPPRWLDRAWCQFPEIDIDEVL